MIRSRRAVILFNLGGPDCLEAVRPFLNNLFSDEAILSMPSLPRLVLAWIISNLREKKSRKIYARIGGKSPILEETIKQSLALQKQLQEQDQEIETKVFIAMRYWFPRASDVVGKVKAWQPDEIILLPLYPQYSTTTTQSSLLEWMREATKQGLQIRHRTICCYPDDKGFLRAHAETIKECIVELQAREKDLSRAVILFSAHGLPQGVIRRGDPYQVQVEKTCAGVIEILRLLVRCSRLDWRICYQSRVGPMKWIGPSIDDAIARLGTEGKGGIIVPISFVSEHSETLVELDQEYRAFAEQKDLAFYYRVKALGSNPVFINSLARLVNQACENEMPVCAQEQDNTPGHPVCELLSLPPFSREKGRLV